ncbi:MAG: hypothetical protein GY835_13590 [bacterium]|nr:hypothetical protein [bacterium]
MREITPYKTVTGALKALDNGGRIFNVFTKSGDGKIANSELLKAAGALAGHEQAFLFFHMALTRLGQDQRQQVVAHLSPALRKQYLKINPLCITIEKFDDVPQPTQPVIVEGYPRFIEDKSQFTAFIMVPIMAGKVMTFMMIPIFDQYDVYELYPDAGLKGDKSIIATVRGSKRLQSVHTTFGGFVKELKFDPKTKNPHSHYIEALYYIKDDK